MRRPLRSAAAKAYGEAKPVHADDLVEVQAASWADFGRRSAQQFAVAHQ